MMDKEETVSACRLCLEYPETTFVELTENIKVITKTVIPELDMELCRKPILCSDCCLCLNELYVFKTTCFVNETHIQHKLINFRSKTLREILGCTKIEKIQIQQPSICRLCFKEDSNKYFSVKPHVADENLRQIITKCLPEINLKLTDDPKICRKCSETLHNFYHFKTTCLEVENTLLYCRKSWKVHRKNLNVNKVLEYHIQKVKEKQKLEQLNQPEEREICIIESVVSLKEKDQEEIIEVNDDDDCCPDLSNDVYITIGDAEEKTETSDISYSKFEADEEKLEAEEEAVVESKSVAPSSSNIVRKLECPKCYFETKDAELMNQHKIKTSNYRLCAKISRILYVEQEERFDLDYYRNLMKKLCEKNKEDPMKVMEISTKKIEQVDKTSSRLFQNKRKSKKILDAYSDTMPLKDFIQSKYTTLKHIVCGECLQIFQSRVHIKNHLQKKHNIESSAVVKVHNCIPQYYFKERLKYIPIENKQVEMRSFRRGISMIKIIKYDQKKQCRPSKSNPAEISLKRLCRNNKHNKNNETQIKYLKNKIIKCSYLVCGICHTVFAKASTLKAHFFTLHNVKTNSRILVATLYNKYKNGVDMSLYKIKRHKNNRQMVFTKKFSYKEILVLKPVEISSNEKKRPTKKRQRELYVRLVRLDFTKILNNKSTDSNDLATVNIDGESGFETNNSMQIIRTMEEAIKEMRENRKNQCIERKKDVIILSAKSVNLDQFDIINIPETIKISKEERQNKRNKKKINCPCSVLSI